MRIESRDQFVELRAQATKIEENRRQQVLVCCGTGCLASGAKAVAEAGHPLVLVSASAVGYYGDGGEHALGDEFLHVQEFL